MNRIQRIPEWVWLAGFGFIIFVLSYISPVNHSTSDPYFSLVLSQSIIEKGEISLDSYEKEAPQLFQALRYQFIEINGRTYYNYPLGSSIAFLPFVGAALAIGKDMLLVADNQLLQNFVSALIVVGIFVLIYLIGRTYLPVLSTIVIALVFLLGSTLISTVGTALWNMNTTVILILLALLLIVRFDSGASMTVHPFLLGALFFAAFLTRPSSAIFILLALGYLFLKDRQELVRCAVTALLLLFLFLIFSRLTYGSWLPIYYRASNWYNPGDIGKAVYGLLLSPSRGLLIYSPFLLVVIIGGLFAVSSIRRSILFWFCVIWFLIQLIAVALTRQWWGGFSYGPRLLTDSIPALILITFIIWSQIVKQAQIRIQATFVSAFISLGLIAIVIHSVQGLFNDKTRLWNAFPNIDIYQEYLFDWQYPQFLTTNSAYHKRLLGHFRSLLAKDPNLIDEYSLGDQLFLGNNIKNAVINGWWSASPNEFWTEIETVRILFKPRELNSLDSYSLELSAGSYGNQVAEIFLNQIPVGSVTFSESRTTNNLEFAGSLFEPNEVNEISIYIPQSRRPGLDDLQDLGLRYWPHQLGLKNMVITISTK